MEKSNNDGCLGFQAKDEDGGSDEDDAKSGEADFLHVDRLPLARAWVLLDGGMGAECILA